jgi:hypothetical protein
MFVALCSYFPIPLCLHFRLLSTVWDVSHQNPICTSHLSCMSVLIVGMVLQLESVSPHFMFVMSRYVLNICVQVLWFINDTTVSKVTSHSDFTTDPVEHETQSVLPPPSPISSPSFSNLSSSSLPLHLLHLLLLLLLICPQCCQYLSLYRYTPHNNVSVNDGPHIQQWSRKIYNIIIWYYNTIVLQLPTVFSIVHVVQVFSLGAIGYM